MWAPAAFRKHGVYPSARDLEAASQTTPSPCISRWWHHGGVNFAVADVPERERFEAHTDDGELAGVLTYQLTGNIIAYTHTQVEERFEGHGAGTALVRAAMDDAKAKNRVVVPICPFLNGWLNEHHEYDKILARSTRKVK